ncbi:MAG: hypothetical protein EON48_16220 [Acetobacteraceae bacterium]|nr:MAG: hypothetical protein EON48_16220 [Acetobacteraceae bacterium]
MSPFPTAILTSLALAACTSIVPSTAARLAAMDPLTADPAAMELVVILPPGFAVSPGSATLKLSADRGAEHKSGRFNLAERPAAAGVNVPEGGSARGFVIAPADVPRMRAFQSEIAAWKREGGAKGSLGMGLGGCAVDGGPSPDSTGSVLIRLREDGPLLPLIAEGKLSDLLGADVLAAIKPCQGAE